MPEPERQLSLPVETLEVLDLPREAREKALQALALLLLHVVDAEHQGESSHES